MTFIALLERIQPLKKKKKRSHIGKHRTPLLINHNHNNFPLSPTFRKTKPIDHHLLVYREPVEVQAVLFILI